MTLKDFIKKYKLSVNEITKACGISPQRLWVLQNGGCHKAMAKYAPIIESLVENRQDNIYIPPKEDATINYKRKERIIFTEEEIELVKEKPYMLPYRTVQKIMNGHLFTKKIHDDIIKALKGEEGRYKGGQEAYRRGG